MVRPVPGRRILFRTCRPELRDGSIGGTKRLHAAPEVGRNGAARHSPLAGAVAEHGRKLTIASRVETHVGVEKGEPMKGASMIISVRRVLVAFRGRERVA